MTEVLVLDNLEPMSGAEITAHWRMSKEQHPKPLVELKASENCLFGFNSFVAGIDGLPIVRAGFLRVAPEIRGQGLGARLVRGLGALSQKYAFPRMSVGIASQYSLPIFEGVFGWDRMTLRTTGEGSMAMNLNGVTAPEAMERLDISFENARAVLVALEETEPDLENRQNGFPVTVDLDGLDMSSWELPKEHCKGKVDIQSLLLK